MPETSDTFTLSLWKYQFSLLHNNYQKLSVSKQYAFITSQFLWVRSAGWILNCSVSPDSNPSISWGHKSLIRGLFSFMFPQVVGRIHVSATVGLRIQFLTGDPLQLLEAVHSFFPHGFLQHGCLLYGTLFLQCEGGNFRVSLLARWSIT